MEEENQIISDNPDISSEFLGDSTINKFKKNKILIISIIAGVIILITLIVVLVIVLKNNGNNKKDPTEIIAQINCLYNIYTTEEKIKLLSDEFNPGIKIEINIDEKNLGFIK